MYSDLIDSVKNTTLNEANLIRSETFLSYSIINGNRPTLTLSQAMDSFAILSIAKDKNFIEMIKEGYIKISLYGQVNSLQGYLLKTLKSNTEQNISKFTFSNMPFLYNEKYSDKQRQSIFLALIKQIEENNPTFDGNLIDNGDKDYIEEYVEAIRKINNAARNSYIPASKTTKQLKDVIHLRINQRLKTVVDNENLKTLLMDISNNCTSNYRTFYHNIINKKVEYYEPLIIDEVKEIIDYCYNEVVASSVNDNEPANLNIPNIFPELAASSTAFSNMETLSKNEITVSDINTNTEYMNWERLLTTLKEIESIQKKKKCNWKEALKSYQAHQRLLPFTLGAKYVGISALTVAISSVPIVGNLFSNFVAELLWNSACDVFGEVTKKPSFNDMIKISKESEKKCKLLNRAVSQTSLNINANK